MNSFRKVAESVVQANRLAIESAKDEGDFNPTEKRRRYDSDLQRWHADSSDTATWLYRMVFLSTPPTQSQGSGTEEHIRHNYQETPSQSHNAVVDERNEEQYISGGPSRELIVWNVATEPSPVVNKLLHSWTRLDSDQINASRAPYAFEVDRSVEAWIDGIAKELQEYELSNGGSLAKDMDSDSENHDRGYLSPISVDSDYESAAEESTVNGETLPEYTGRRVYSHGKQHEEDQHQSKSGESDSDVSTTVRIPHNPPSHRQRRRQPQHRAGPHKKKVSFPDVMPQAYSNPFQPEFWPPSAERPPSPHHTYMPQVPPQRTMSGNYNTGYPPLGHHNPFPPPPPPPQPNPNLHAEQTASDILAKDDQLVSKLVSLISETFKQGGTAPPSQNIFSGIDLLMNRRFEQEEERASATHHAQLNELKQFVLQHTQSQARDWQEVIAAHKAALSSPNSSEGLLRLENLFLEQRVEQFKRHEESEVGWRAAKAAADANSAKEAEESQELMRREIKEEKAAKRAAEKTLQFAKEQAAKRAQEVAEAKATREKKMLEDEQKKIMEMYEEKLAAFTREWRELSTVQNHGLALGPYRHTSIFQGNRRIEVAEFANHNARHAKPHPLHRLTCGRQDIHSDADKWVYSPQDISHNIPVSVTSTNGSTSALPPIPAERTSTSRQQRILPPLAGKPCSKTMDLQASLQQNGILAGPHHSYDTESVHFQGPEDLIVMSTLFWDSPQLSLGSDLLSTLRCSGWRPHYARISGLCRQTLSLLFWLTSCRCRSNLFPW